MRKAIIKDITMKRVSGNKMQMVYILMIAFTVFMSGTSFAAAPSQPSSLNQYKNDGSTAIAQNGITDERLVKIKGTVTDSDSQAQLQVEIRDTNNAFTGVPNCFSPMVNPGGWREHGHGYLQRPG
jgi:hypothetical protein